ncbi:MAG: M48 family peptidase [Betaproteobacteria bacterium]|nr:M48 family peptidase [Betaproteobacteria bacterium]
MQFRRFFVSLLIVSLLAGQVSAQILPELGDQSSSVVSPQMERRIGEEAMQDIRLRDPAFMDDPEITDYINTIGQRLVAASLDARQSFEFFMMREPAINAFAMPGGFVGVNTGLLLAAQTESEVASVLAHEVTHVTQHHIARIIGKQDQFSVVGMAAMLVAILAARSNPQAAQAAIATATAGAIQTQLNYTRDFEREADRIGFQVLRDAGFDVQGMPAFFERLQKAGRHYDNNAPAYLRTHPLTTERIADMQNRAYGAGYRQLPDSLEFHLVRGRLRADVGTPREAVAHYESLLKDKRYASESGARYGYACALLRNRQYAVAETEIGKLQPLGNAHPMFELLRARIKSESGNIAAARAILQASLARFPDYRPVTYALVEADQASTQHPRALAYLDDLIRAHPHDARLYQMRAKSYAATGKRLLQHQAQAEAYFRMGALGASIEQLQLAQKSGDGDFYQMSSVDARLRELRALRAEQTRKR